MTAPFERDVRLSDQAEWASDLFVECLTACGIEFITLNPGASLRGLHDSLVNHPGAPRMVLCLHEDAAVAIAHGYAKVRGMPMAVGVHANVGLMHASMGLFNAFCDRVPMVVVGGNGPLDATQRRPWIDWIHTTQDPAALIRNYVKWDDQPSSIDAAVRALIAAAGITMTYPHAPTYVSLDATLQESSVPKDFFSRSFSGGSRGADVVPSSSTVQQAADLLAAAQSPVVLVGRVARDESDWQRRIQLAELLGAAVVTDFKTGATFPTRHPLHVNRTGGLHLPPEAASVLAAADVILALDWIDLDSTVRGAGADAATLISASLDGVLHNGWSKDGGVTVSADVVLGGAPDRAVELLVEEFSRRDHVPSGRSSKPVVPPLAPPAHPRGVPLHLADVVRTLRGELAGTRACVVRAPHRSWPLQDWPFEHPLDYLGYDGGGGLGSGPGMTVGAALALRGSEWLAVGVIGDGDYLQGVTALWTAAAEAIPLLLIVANNGTYQTDEAHQVTVAQRRSRPIELAHVGQRFTSPPIDLAGLARAQGATGIGPLRTEDELRAGVAEAVAAARAGATVVVDAVVDHY